MGMALSDSHDYVLAQRNFEEPPTVNDLARLLADAMQRPLAGPIHRPGILYLRAGPKWAELLPHLKQIGIKAVAQDALPKWDRNFGDLQAKVEQARATLTRGRHRTAEGESMPENTDNSERAFQELVRVLEEAARAGAHSVGLEYKGRDLMVFHNFGNAALGAARIPQELQQDVLDLDRVIRPGMTQSGRSLEGIAAGIVETFDESFQIDAHAILPLLMGR